VRAIAQVAAADAVVISTPVYKASYAGILKAFLDLLPQDGLDGKLVLPVATGGSQSHMLALDYALRPVLASLSARFILPSIYTTSDQLQWNAENGLLLDAAICGRVARGIDQLSSELFALSLRRPQPFFFTSLPSPERSISS
jgi:FMN reductase